MLLQKIITRSLSSASRRALIQNNTELCSSPLVPELKLYLLTPKVNLWFQPDDGRFGGADPFWSIFWPGGQALSRYVMDNGHWLAGKRALDLGCGSGAVGLAALVAGAVCPVTFNDIDPLALESVLLNSEVNGLLDQSMIRLSSHDYLQGALASNADKLAHDFDVLFVGDLFYDDGVGARLNSLIELFVNRHGKLVLVGDPGRHALRSSPLDRSLSCIAKYHLPPEIAEQNFGFSTAFVFRCGETPWNKG